MEDVCLLCLELRHESVDCIYVVSRQWEEAEIEQLIEQHFWPIESITANSWLCAACWYVLKEFHKFYIRIEDAHEDLAITKKTVKSPAQHQPEVGNDVNDFEELIDKDLSKDISCFNIVINLNDLDQALSKEQPVQHLFPENETSLEQLPIGAFIENYIQQDQDNIQTIQYVGEERDAEHSADHVDQGQIIAFLEDSMRHEQDIPSIDCLQSNLFFEEEEGVGSFDDVVQNQLSRLLDDYVHREQEPALDLLGTCDIVKVQKEKDTNDDRDVDGENGDNATENEGTDEQPITDDEYAPKYRRDPLKKHLFTKASKIPKLIIESDNTSMKLFKSPEDGRSEKINLQHSRTVGKVIPKVPEKSHGEKPEAEACNGKTERKITQTETGENAIKNNVEVTKDDDIDEETVSDDEDIQNYQRDPLKKLWSTKDKQPVKKLTENISTDSPEETSANKSKKRGRKNTTAASEVVREKLRHKVSKKSPKEETPSAESCNENTDDTQSQPDEKENRNTAEDLEVAIDFPIECRTDSNSEGQSDNESSALNQCKSRLTQGEYDDFLANNFKIICDICQEEVKTFSELRTHFSTIHNKRVYALCCKRKFLSRRTLVEHIRWHCEPDTYKCKYCGKVMSTRRCLDSHEKHVHEKKFTRFNCEICGKSFASANVLKNHKLIHLSNEEKKFQCNDCGKKYGSNTLLSNHIRAVHMAKYIKICDICGKKLRCREDFQRHMLGHEGVPVPLVTCDICGIQMIKERDLRRHKIIKHPDGGKVEYKCHLCPRVSDSLIAHRKHINYTHELKATFKCSLCPKAFKRQPTLNEHMAYHTKNPLYTCPYCPKTFYSNANMHTHRKKDHPIEWIEARRKKYSGKLPPNHIPPSTLPLD